MISDPEVYTVDRTPRIGVSDGFGGIAGAFAGWQTIHERNGGISQAEPV
jgi:hypothetical protein